jgi:hypothetical protein
MIFKHFKRSITSYSWNPSIPDYYQGKQSTNCAIAKWIHPEMLIRKCSHVVE